MTTVNVSNAHVRQIIEELENNPARKQLKDEALTLLEEIEHPVSSTSQMVNILTYIDKFVFLLFFVVVSVYCLQNPNECNDIFETTSHFDIRKMMNKITKSASARHVILQVFDYYMNSYGLKAYYMIGMQAKDVFIHFHNTLGTHFLKKVFIILKNMTMACTSAVSSIYSDTLSIGIKNTIRKWFRPYKISQSVGKAISNHVPTKRTTVLSIITIALAFVSFVQILWAAMSITKNQFTESSFTGYFLHGGAQVTNIILLYLGKYISSIHPKRVLTRSKRSRNNSTTNTRSVWKRTRDVVGKRPMVDDNKNKIKNRNSLNNVFLKINNPLFEKNILNEKEFRTMNKTSL